MNFLEAVKAMKEGKKVRLRNSICGLDGFGNIGIQRIGKDNGYYKNLELTNTFVQATDWEIVEKKEITLQEWFSGLEYPIYWGAETKDILEDLKDKFNLEYPTKEKKTLSGKIVPKEHDTNNYVVPEHLKPEDVKEAIWRMLNKLGFEKDLDKPDNYILASKVYSTAKETFGGRLI